MTMTKNEMTLKIAIEQAINEMGIDAFKRTSFFISNHVISADTRKAA
ncbi:hypothetical protein JHL21_02640 [Devosia sp. WQ 349]|nr:hypothetical protein [Devosia sp. WQ 349K1]MBK1793394.1 hypothetical protein [Devosia sp. WQ 349K1]